MSSALQAFQTPRAEKETLASQDPFVEAQLTARGKLSKQVIRDLLEFSKQSREYEESLSEYETDTLKDYVRYGFPLNQYLRTNIVDRNADYFRLRNEEDLELDFLVPTQLRKRFGATFDIPTVANALTVDILESMMKDAIVVIQKVLLNAPKVPHDVHVYRGLSRPFSCGDELRGFSSTSWDLWEAGEFGVDGYILDIIVPKGTPLFVMHTLNETEREALLPAGSSFLCVREQAPDSVFQELVLDISRLLVPSPEARESPKRLSAERKQALISSVAPSVLQDKMRSKLVSSIYRKSTY